MPMIIFSLFEAVLLSSPKVNEEQRDSKEIPNHSNVDT